MKLPGSFRAAVVLLALLASSGAAGAQQTGGTITGAVRDTARRPVVGADVVAQPGSHRTRTDFTRHLPVRGGVPGQRAEPLVLRPPDP